MPEYILPEGITIGPIREPHGEFEVFKDEEIIGSIWWHGNHKASIRIQTDLPKADSDYRGYINASLGYCDPQTGINMIVALSNFGQIKLPAVRIELYDKKTYVEVKPYGIGVTDGVGGFNLTYRSKGGWGPEYKATISQLKNGSWRAAYFNYDLVPSQIVASMEILAVAPTRQEVLDAVIAVFEVDKN